MKRRKKSGRKIDYKKKTNRGKGKEQVGKYREVKRRYDRTL